VLSNFGVGDNVDVLTVFGIVISIGDVDDFVVIMTVVDVARNRSNVWLTV